MEDTIDKGEIGLLWEFLGSLITKFENGLKCQHNNFIRVEEETYRVGKL